MKNRGIPQLRFDPQGSVKTTLPETFPNFKEKDMSPFTFSFVPLKSPNRIKFLK